MGRAKPDVRPPVAAIPSAINMNSRNSCRSNGSRPTAVQRAAPIGRAGAAALRTLLAICVPGPMSRPQSFGVKSGIFFQSRM